MTPFASLRSCALKDLTHIIIMNYPVITLVVDEFDASIHPMALMNIINIFHNDEINTKHAQLIFNTHNPIFLNPNLYRRDEINFIERDDDSHCSTHYTLPALLLIL